MKTKLLELMDFDKVDTLLEGFNKTTGFVTAIIDLEGKVLSKSGWRQICTEIHRINPETAKKCTISDTELARKSAGGEKYHFYKCLNGLVDVAVPMVINGEHIANLFSGQFFFEEPDTMFFKKQAEKYGFDEKKYMDALGKVPVVSKEKVQVALDFLLNMTRLISETIFQKLEQTELNKALKESEEEYRNLIEISPVAMSIIHDWKTIYFNPAAVQLFGAKTQNELLGKYVFELIHPDFHELAKKNAKLLVENGYVNMQEQKYVKLDGNVLDVETQAKSIRFNDDTATLVVIYDITKRKQAEQALVHSHDLMRYVIENNNGAIAIHDKDLKYIYVSQRYLHDYKVKEKDIIGKHHYDVFPDLPQKWRDVHQKALAGVISRADNDPYPREDGTLEWTRWECRPWYEVDGSIGGIIIYTEVITERMQMVEDLRKSEENLSITLRSIGDGVISTDINGLIVNMNPVAEKLCGWGLDEAAGKPLTEVFKIINDLTRETVADPVKKVSEKGDIVGLANHTLLISKNGNEYQIADSAAPIKNKEGAISGVVLVFSDVSEKYAAQKQIKASEERFQLAMNASNDGLFDWNLETNEIYYAPSWKKMLGYDDHEIPNDFSVWENTTDPEDVKKSWELQQKLITKQIDQFVLEFKMKHKSGHWVDILSRAKAIYDDNGKAIRIVGTHTDITERKQAEEALRKSQEMMISSQSVAHICSYSTDLNENELDKSTWVCSPQFYKIFGIDKTYPHTIAGWAGFIHPDHREELVAYHESVVKEKKSFNHEYKIIRINDGAERWVHGTGELEYDKEGKPIRMFGAIQDITERKQAEKQVKLLNRAVESSSVSVVIANADGVIVYTNPWFTQVTGYPAEEVLGRRMRILNPGKLSESDSETLWRAIHSGNEWSGEYQNRRKNGELYWEKSVISPIMSSAGELTNIIAINEDITSIKNMLEELVQAKEKAEESDRLKSAFLANMSHEIRTPMNGILGFAELLKEPNLKGDEQQKYIGIIEKSGARMLNIINDIIDISKIESGLMKVKNSAINVNEHLDQILTFFTPEAEAKNIKLICNPGLPNKETFVTTDSEKFYAILTNLVKNALKYTETGFIEFGYNHQPNHSYLQFYVKDTGIGIPKNRQEAIFERFIQADILDKMAWQGAGLGLSISKAYIEMLKGKIWVESEEGIGSTFYFTLPCSTDPKEKTTVKNGVPAIAEGNVGGSLKILIAEDDEVSGELISIHVRKFGKEIINVQNGREAVEACRNNPGIDLVLMDIQMPELNGYEATRQIRQFNTEVIIIALTAFALAGDREKAIEAGCNDYVSKPIKRRDLLEKIQQYF